MQHLVDIKINQKSNKMADYFIFVLIGPSIEIVVLNLFLTLQYILDRQYSDIIKYILDHYHNIDHKLFLQQSTKIQNSAAQAIKYDEYKFQLSPSMKQIHKPRYHIS